MTKEITLGFGCKQRVNECQLQEAVVGRLEALDEFSESVLDSFEFGKIAEGVRGKSVHVCLTAGPQYPHIKLDGLESNADGRIFIVRLRGQLVEGRGGNDCIRELIEKVSEVIATSIPKISPVELLSVAYAAKSDSSLREERHLYFLKQADADLCEIDWDSASKSEVAKLLVETMDC